MAVFSGAVGRWVRKSRARLKSFAYSGLARGRWQHPDRVLAALRLEQGARVADIGAGAGYFSFRLLPFVGRQGRVYAVDTDPDMWLLMTEKVAREGWGNIVAVRARPDDPALPETVDAALLVNAFHHLPAPDLYLVALARYLRPRGKVAVIEALPRWFLFGHATEPDRIRSSFVAAGYVAIEEHDFLPRQSFLVFERAD